MTGVVVANEVLDAMPVDLLHFDGATWQRARRRARRRAARSPGPIGRRRRDRRSTAGFPAGSTTELHAQARAFVATLADRLARGAIFLVDYGFPEAEYYHPQRSGGTLMCHRAPPRRHRSAGRRRPQGHHDAPRLQRARRRRPGRRARRHRLHVAGALSSQLRSRRRCSPRPARRRAATRSSSSTSTRWASCSRCSPSPRERAFAPIGFASGDRRHRL